MLTVLMATYNAARTLGLCLDAYCRMEQPASGWKIVIADNGSTDSTLAVVESYASRLPIKVCHEPARGKNAALNRGLDHISGDLVVFTDDDAIPHPAWLISLREAADSHPDYALFGGKILPRWERAPEAWILDWVPLDVTYAVTPAALREGKVDADCLFGPNLAVRASVFTGGHRFDASIGPRANRSYAMGSETEFCLRMQRAGLLSWHVESAVVEHIVRDFQTEPGWIFRRARNFGRGAYRLRDAKRYTGSFTLCGVPHGLIEYAAMQAAKSLLALLRGDRRASVESRWRLHYALGEILESRNPDPR